MLRDLLDGHWSAPVVIGGTGGSGTRLVARLLREMGVELGAQVNGTEDALSFVPLYDRYVNPYLARGALDSAAFEADLLKAIREHRGPDAGKVWGWKNPRSIFLLPVLDGLIAGLKFVHVVRHGLDMALSSNQNQVRLHAAAALGAQCADLAPEMRAALLWKKANAIAADYASAMPGRYFRLRYEDVCADPTGAMTPVAAALGLTLPRGGWREPVEPAIPRWTSLDPETLAGIKARIGDALARFGYAC